MRMKNEFKYFLMGYCAIVLIVCVVVVVVVTEYDKKAQRLEEERVFTEQQDVAILVKQNRIAEIEERLKFVAGERAKLERTLCAKEEGKVVMRITKTIWMCIDKDADFRVHTNGGGND